ncbi:MAG: hypothetical protein ACOYT4_02970 [Nanoarchaeota archaeon]
MTKGLRDFQRELIIEELNGSRTNKIIEYGKTFLQFSAVFIILAGASYIIPSHNSKYNRMNVMRIFAQKGDTITDYARGEVPAEEIANYREVILRMNAGAQFIGEDYKLREGAPYYIIDANGNGKIDRGREDDNILTCKGNKTLI